MQQLRKRMVCLVESGWEGIRKLTITLADHNVPSVCIIKGKLEKEVLGIITKYNQISLKSIRRSIFKLYIFMMFLKNFILQNTICIITDSKKNYSWVSAINRILGIKTILLVEGDHDYMLLLNERPQDIKFILNLAKEQRQR